MGVLGRWCGFRGCRTKAAAKAMGLDDATSKSEEQEEEESNRQTDAPSQRSHGFCRFLSVGDQIIKRGAQAEDNDQEDQKDDDFQEGSSIPEKGQRVSARDSVQCAIIDLFPRPSV